MSYHIYRKLSKYPHSGNHNLSPTQTYRFLFNTHPVRQGGAKRDQLLKDFVCRCFAPSDDFNKNEDHYGPSGDEESCPTNYN